MLRKIPFYLTLLFMNNMDLNGKLLSWISTSVQMFMWVYGLNLYYTSGNTGLLRLRSDPTHGHQLRWALSSNDEIRCNCTRVLAAHNVNGGIGSPLPCKPYSASDGHWFADNPGMLTSRNSWRNDSFKCLLGCPCEITAPTTIVPITTPISTSTATTPGCDTNPCCNNPCQNNATCVLDDTNVGYTCHCVLYEGWSGKLCGRVCRDKLGMESGTILDNQITTSSQLYDQFSPSNARLNAVPVNDEPGAWVALHLNTQQWIQVDLMNDTIITGVIIQGRDKTNEILAECQGPGDSCHQWVTRFKIEYKPTNFPWKVATDYNKDEVTFDGNTDSRTPVEAWFPRKYTARYVRIVPLQYNRHISLRFELLGCEV
ncbi:uncharacterized protein [Amphiura filiformis]|uniref:uncharacterized protein n=1 Tax=Amphiura filiformis TaxID=82378 RepID=UPI003B22744E